MGSQHQARISARAIFNFSIILAVLLIAFSVFYYFVIFPSKSSKERETKVTDCLIKVEANYKQTWDKYCKSEGLNSGCKLPVNLADAADNNRKQLREECY